MTTAAANGPRAVGELSRRWLAGLVGGALGLIATYVLATGDPLAAVGIVVVGLAAMWLVVDFESGAIALLAGSLLVPNGVALYFGPSLPLLTFQRVMFLLLVGAALAHGPVRFIRGLWRTPGIALLWGMVAAMGIATVLSIDPVASTREFLTERAIGLPFYFAVVWLALPDREAAAKLLRVVGAVGLVISLVAVVEAITGQGVVAGLGLLPPQKLKDLGYYAVLERRAGFPRVESVFQHPLILGAFFVAYVPLVVAFRMQARSRMGRWFWSVALVLALASLVLTWSRGAWIALLIALVILRGGGVRTWLLVGVGALAFVLVWSRLGFLQPSKLLYRWWLLSAVAAALTRHFGFGSGPGTFAKRVVVYVAGTDVPAGTDAMAYSLTMAIEAGPVFALLLWWFMLRTLRLARQARVVAHRDGDTGRAFLLDALRAGILANLLLSVVSASLFGPTVGLFVLFMLAAVALRLAAPDPARGP